jgi:hypothetical protein
MRSITLNGYDTRDPMVLEAAFGDQTLKVRFRPSFRPLSRNAKTHFSPFSLTIERQRRCCDFRRW